jgi:putative membrane protein
MIDYLLKISLIFVALQHFGFLVLEMFFWRKPLGRKIFRLKEEQAKQSAALAANQGLYNGFLGAGLVIGAFFPSGEVALAFTFFFLCCVIIAGLFGGFTVSRKIFFVQSFPALAALALAFIQHYN